MEQGAKLFLRQYCLRWLFWVLVLLPLLPVQFYRKKLDMVHIWAGSGEVTIFVMPSTLGVEYLPEVYRKTLFELRTRNYKGLPFDAPYFDERINTDKYLNPSLNGFFFYCQYNYGGPHWSKSAAIPFWFVEVLIAALLVFIPNLPRWKFLALPNAGINETDADAENHRHNGVDGGRRDRHFLRDPVIVREASEQ